MSQDRSRTRFGIGNHLSGIGFLKISFSFFKAILKLKTRMEKINLFVFSNTEGRIIIYFRKFKIGKKQHYNHNNCKLQKISGSYF